MQLFPMPDTRTGAVPEAQDRPGCFCLFTLRHFGSELKLLFWDIVSWGTGKGKAALPSILPPWHCRKPSPAVMFPKQAAFQGPDI